MHLALTPIECQLSFMADSTLDPRLRRLLTAVVEMYERTAEPVSSQAIVDTAKLGVSSATVRNWFMELDALGLSQQPHTSGGRIPTEEGYRLYTELLLPIETLSPEEAEPFTRLAREHDDRILRAKALARALAERSVCGLFLRFGAHDSYYTGLSRLFQQPEFRDWQKVVSLSEVLDRLDEALDTFTSPHQGTPFVLVGSHGPFGAGCSTVCLERDGVLMGFLGPLRMNYRYAYQALALVDTFLPL